MINIIIISLTVASHDDLNQIIENFKILNKEILPKVEGKKTVKKILKQLKTYESVSLSSFFFVYKMVTGRNTYGCFIYLFNFFLIHFQLNFDEDGDGYGYASDTSIEDGNSSVEIDYQDQENYPEINIRGSTPDSSSSSTKSENAIVSEKVDKGKNKLLAADRDQPPDRLDFSVNQSDYSDLNSDSSDAEGIGGGVDGGSGADGWLSLGNDLIYSLMSWLEGPPVETKQATTTNNNPSNNKNQTILEIPMQFIALLTFPEIDDPKKASFAGKKNFLFLFSYPIFYSLRIY